MPSPRGGSVEPNNRPMTPNESEMEKAEEAIIEAGVELQSNEDFHKLAAAIASHLQAAEERGAARVVKAVEAKTAATSAAEGEGKSKTKPSGI